MLFIKIFKFKESIYIMYKNILIPNRDMVRAAANDFSQAIRKPGLWIEVGWLDVKQRYRRSMLGPFWITLSVAAFVLGLGIVYAGLFGQPLAEYLPYVGIGLIFWLLLSSLINDGCAAFISAEGAIKQVAVPLSVHVLRAVWRNIIISAHHAVIIVFLILVFGVPINWSAIFVIPALLNLAVFGVGLALVLGLLSARFRDVPLLITNFVMLAFFVTPIIWRAEALPPDRAFIAKINPFNYIIAIARDPLLGAPPPYWYWGVSIGCTIFTLFVAFLLFARFRARIPYWL